jgi:hypothetical protein
MTYEEVNEDGHELRYNHDYSTLAKISFRVNSDVGMVYLAQNVTQTIQLENNCATKVKASRFLLFVGCSHKGLMEVYRTDTMAKVEQKNI